MTRRILAMLFVMTLTGTLLAQTDEPTKIKTRKPAKPAPSGIDERLDLATAQSEAALQQARLAREFRDFEAALLRLKQRLEASPNQEDREKAVQLGKAMEKINQASIDTKFSKVVELLRSPKTLTLDQLDKAKDQHKDLARDIQIILEMLLRDDRDAELKAEKDRLNTLLQEVKRLTREEERIRALIERGLTDNRTLKKNQEGVAKDTEAVLRGLGKNSQSAEAKSGKPGEAKGEGKPGEAKGESKNDTKEAKGTDRDSSKGKGGSKSDGDNKDGSKSDGSKSDGDNKDGSKSDGSNKSGSKSDGSKSDGDNKGGSKGGDGKGPQNDDKKGEAKGEGNKNDQEGKILTRPEGKKPGDPKAEKKGEGKPGDTKDNKGSAQSGSKSDSKGKGDNKSEAKGPQSGSQSQSGSQGQSKGQQGQQSPGGSKGGGQQQQQAGNQQPSENSPGRKQIEDARKEMERVIQNLEKNKNDDASDDATRAIEELKKAQRKLEELLKALREEEIERILADLQRRCERMLALQIEVRDGTLGVYKSISETADKKPSRNDEQRSLALSDRQNEIVDLANKAIDMLKNEGSAVAFPEVFIQVRSDMINVSRRLRKTDVGVVTQTIENDIIDTLKEMIQALKKAQQENKEKKAQKPQQQKPGQGGQPQDRKLIELLAELKMIRSMQVRVYNRTVTYGKEYPQQEQAPHPDEFKNDPAAREKAEMIQKELKELARFQQKITDVTKKIATGQNKAN